NPDRGNSEGPAWAWRSSSTSASFSEAGSPWRAAWGRGAFSACGCPGSARAGEQHRRASPRHQERTRRLQSSVEELEGFAYTVAHDLRAPLRSMAGFSRLVQEDLSGKLEAPAQDYLSRIEGASRRMDDM